MPFLVLRHLCLLGFFDSFWRLFSLMHLFLSPLKFPMGLDLYLVLSFVGMHFAATSMCALTKFSYSSFGVLFSVLSCCVSYPFLNSNMYLSLISLLFRRAHSVWWSLFVWRFFVGLAVFSPWLFDDRWTHPRKRSIPHNSLHYFSISCL